MDRLEKKRLRSTLFCHLDGIAMAPTVSTLHHGGIIEYILKYPHFSFQELSREFEFNGGYLNVSLRLLASQGWLERKILKDGEEIDFKLTEKVSDPDFDREAPGRRIPCGTGAGPRERLIHTHPGALNPTAVRIPWKVVRASL